MNSNNKNNNSNPEENPVPKKKMSTLKIIGISLLVLIGIPIVVFGICMFVMFN